MFRRSTHAAFRARSFCDHWRGEQQRRRETSRAVGPDAAARREEKALGRQLQHHVRGGSWQWVVELDGLLAVKRQTVQLGGHARESESPTGH
jgi:hypothetical protein